MASETDIREPVAESFLQKNVDENKELLTKSFETALQNLPQEEKTTAESEFMKSCIDIEKVKNTIEFDVGSTNGENTSGSPPVDNVTAAESRESSLGVQSSVAPIIPTTNFQKEEESLDQEVEITTSKETSQKETQQNKETSIGSDEVVLEEFKADSPTATTHQIDGETMNSSNLPDMKLDIKELAEACNDENEESISGTNPESFEEKMSKTTIRKAEEKESENLFNSESKKIDPELIQSSAYAGEISNDATRTVHIETQIPGGTDTEAKENDGHAETDLFIELKTIREETSEAEDGLDQTNTELTTSGNNIADNQFKSEEIGANSTPGDSAAISRDWIKTASENSLNENQHKVEKQEDVLEQEEDFRRESKELASSETSTLEQRDDEKYPVSHGDKNEITGHEKDESSKDEESSKNLPKDEEIFSGEDDDGTEDSADINGESLEEKTVSAVDSMVEETTEERGPKARDVQEKDERNVQDADEADRIPDTNDFRCTSEEVASHIQHNSTSQTHSSKVDDEYAEVKSAANYTEESMLQPKMKSEQAHILTSHSADTITNVVAENVMVTNSNTMSAQEVPDQANSKEDLNMQVSTVEQASSVTEDITRSQDCEVSEESKFDKKSEDAAEQAESAPEEITKSYDKFLQKNEDEETELLTKSFETALQNPPQEEKTTAETESVKSSTDIEKVKNSIEFNVESTNGKSISGSPSVDNDTATESRESSLGVQSSDALTIPSTTDIFEHNFQKEEESLDQEVEIITSKEISKKETQEKSIGSDEHDEVDEKCPVSGGDKNETKKQGKDESSKDEESSKSLPKDEEIFVGGNDDGTEDSANINRESLEEKKVLAVGSMVEETTEEQGLKAHDVQEKDERNMHDAHEADRIPDTNDFGSISEEVASHIQQNLANQTGNIEVDDEYAEVRSAANYPEENALQPQVKSEQAHILTSQSVDAIPSIVAENEMVTDSDTMSAQEVPDQANSKEDLNMQGSTAEQASSVTEDITTSQECKVSEEANFDKKCEDAAEQVESRPEEITKSYNKKSEDEEKELLTESIETALQKLPHEEKTKAESEFIKSSTDIQKVKNTIEFEVGKTDEENTSGSPSVDNVTTSESKESSPQVHSNAAPTIPSTVGISEPNLKKEEESFDQEVKTITSKETSTKENKQHKEKSVRSDKHDEAVVPEEFKAVSATATMHQIAGETNNSSNVPEVKLDTIKLIEACNDENEENISRTNPESLKEILLETSIQKDEEKESENLLISESKKTDPAPVHPSYDAEKILNDSARIVPLQTQILGGTGTEAKENDGDAERNLYIQLKTTREETSEAKIGLDQTNAELTSSGNDIADEKFISEEIDANSTLGDSAAISRDWIKTESEILLNENRHEVEKHEVVLDQEEDFRRESKELASLETSTLEQRDDEKYPVSRGDKNKIKGHEKDESSKDDGSSKNLPKDEEIFVGGNDDGTEDSADINGEYLQEKKVSTVDSMVEETTEEQSLEAHDVQEKDERNVHEADEADRILDTNDFGSISEEVASHTQHNLASKTGSSEVDDEYAEVKRAPNCTEESALQPQAKSEQANILTSHSSDTITNAVAERVMVPDSTTMSVQEVHDQANSKEDLNVQVSTVEQASLIIEDIARSQERELAVQISEESNFDKKNEDAAEQAESAPEEITKSYDKTTKVEDISECKDTKNEVPTEGNEMTHDSQESIIEDKITDISKGDKMKTDILNQEVQEHHEADQVTNDAKQERAVHNLEGVAAEPAVEPSKCEEETKRVNTDTLGITIIVPTETQIRGDCPKAAKENDGDTEKNLCIPSTTVEETNEGKDEFGQINTESTSNNIAGDKFVSDEKEVNSTYEGEGPAISEDFFRTESDKPQRESQNEVGKREEVLQQVEILHETSTSEQRDEGKSSSIPYEVNNEVEGHEKDEASKEEENPKNLLLDELLERKLEDSQTLAYKEVPSSSVQAEELNSNGEMRSTVSLEEIIVGGNEDGTKTSVNDNEEILEQKLPNSDSVVEKANEDLVLEARDVPGEDEGNVNDAHDEEGALNSQINSSSQVSCSEGDDVHAEVKGDENYTEEIGLPQGEARFGQAHSHTLQSDASITSIAEENEAVRNSSTKPSEEVPDQTYSRDDLNLQGSSGKEASKVEGGPSRNQECQVFVESNFVKSEDACEQAETTNEEITEYLDKVLEFREIGQLTDDGLQIVEQDIAAKDNLEAFAAEPEMEKGKFEEKEEEDTYTSTEVVKEVLSESTMPSEGAEGQMMSEKYCMEETMEKSIGQETFQGESSKGYNRTEAETDKEAGLDTVLRSLASRETEVEDNLNHAAKDYMRSTEEIKDLDTKGKEPYLEATASAETPNTVSRTGDQVVTGEVILFDTIERDLQDSSKLSDKEKKHETNEANETTDGNNEGMVENKHSQPSPEGGLKKESEMDKKEFEEKTDYHNNRVEDLEINDMNGIIEKVVHENRILSEDAKAQVMTEKDCTEVIMEKSMVQETIQEDQSIKGYNRTEAETDKEAGVDGVLPSLLSRETRFEDNLNHGGKDSMRSTEEIKESDNESKEPYFAATASAEIPRTQDQVSTGEALLFDKAENDPRDFSKISDEEKKFETTEANEMTDGTDEGILENEYSRPSPEDREPKMEKKQFEDQTDNRDNRIEDLKIIDIDRTVEKDIGSVEPGKELPFASGSVVKEYTDKSNSDINVTTTQNDNVSNDQNRESEKEVTGNVLLYDQRETKETKKLRTEVEVEERREAVQDDEVPLGVEYVDGSENIDQQQGKEKLTDQDLLSSQMDANHEKIITSELEDERIRKDGSNLIEKVTVTGENKLTNEDESIMEQRKENDFQTERQTRDADDATLHEVKHPYIQSVGNLEPISSDENTTKLLLGVSESAKLDEEASSITNAFREKMLESSKENNRKDHLETSNNKKNSDVSPKMNMAEEATMKEIQVDTETANVNLKSEDYDGAEDVESSALPIQLETTEVKNPRDKCDVVEKLDTKSVRFEDEEITTDSATKSTDQGIEMLLEPEEIQTKEKSGIDVTERDASKGIDNRNDSTGEIIESMVGNVTASDSFPIAEVTVKFQTTSSVLLPEVPGLQVSVSERTKDESRMIDKPMLNETLGAALMTDLAETSVHKELTGLGPDSRFTKHSTNDAMIETEAAEDAERSAETEESIELGTEGTTKGEDNLKPDEDNLREIDDHLRVPFATRNETPSTMTSEICMEASHEDARRPEVNLQNVTEVQSAAVNPKVKEKEMEQESPVVTFDARTDNSVIKNVDKTTQCDTPSKKIGDDVMEISDPRLPREEICQKSHQEDELKPDECPDVTTHKTSDSKENESQVEKIEDMSKETVLEEPEQELPSDETITGRLHEGQERNNDTKETAELEVHEQDNKLDDEYPRTEVKALSKEEHFRLSMSNTLGSKAEEEEKGQVLEEEKKNAGFCEEKVEDYGSLTEKVEESRSLLLEGKDSTFGQRKGSTVEESEIQEENKDFHVMAPIKDSKNELEQEGGNTDIAGLNCIDLGREMQDQEAVLAITFESMGKGQNESKEAKILTGNKSAAKLEQNKMAEILDAEGETLKPLEIEHEVGKSEEDLGTSKENKKEEEEPAINVDELQAENDETGKDFEEKENQKGDEEKITDSGSEDIIIVEASRDVDAKSSHKKSHNILSGFGSKVKHSISKVKKAVTGKSSHAKPLSPK